MTGIEVLLGMFLVLGTCAFLAAPIINGSSLEEDTALAGRRADLETARDAKYREIRESELDYRTGKLSEADWRSLDRELRGEAVAILRELDELEAGDAKLQAE